jgi:hypothetical protein
VGGGADEHRNVLRSWPGTNLARQVPAAAVWQVVKAARLPARVLRDVAEERQGRRIVVDHEHERGCHPLTFGSGAGLFAMVVRDRVHQ